MNDIFFNLDNVLKQCPSVEEIVSHKNAAQDICKETILPMIHQFISTGEEETMSISEDFFADNWTYALSMSILGDLFDQTDVIVSYIRGDRGIKPSIGFTNRKLKLTRLQKELAAQQDKLKNVQEGTSKFEKITEKIKKLNSEIQKYEK